MKNVLLLQLNNRQNVSTFVYKSIIFHYTHLISFLNLANDDSISDMLAVINRHEEENPPSNDSALAINALPHSIRHQFLIDAVTQDFLAALYNVRNEKWTTLLQV